ncbi:pyridoxamine 5'-phosphate oxidase, partial [cyanobacterium TDX16]
MGFDRDRTLSEADLAADPLDQYRTWLAEATEAGLDEPQAAVIITSTPDGHPSGRHVLVRRTSATAFGVFTNEESRKAREMTANPHVALVVGWVPMGRQVLVTGVAEPMTDTESDEYFASRPRGSQIAAWASKQSTVIPDRAFLEQRVAEETERWEGRDVERPPNWGGFWITPEAVELWQGRESRLHDRLRYRRPGPDQSSGSD